jgi:hypothetical protein
MINTILIVSAFVAAWAIPVVYLLMKNKKKNKHTQIEIPTVQPTPEPEKPEEPVQPEEPIEPETGCCTPQKDRYQYKVMKVIMNFDCVSELSFEIDKDMVLESVETKNVYDIRLLVNGELMDFDSDIKFLNGDKITVRITQDDVESASEVTLVGYDPEVAVDTMNIAESSLDEEIGEEDILINPAEDNEQS